MPSLRSTPCAERGGSILYDLESPAMRSPGVLSLSLTLLLAALSPAGRGQDGTGAIEGTIAWPGDLDPSHVVVYLEGDLDRGDPARVHVVQSGVQFTPSFVAFPMGGHIAFVNDEPREITHNVFSRSPAWSVDLGLFGPGSERESEFPSPGLVRVMCSIHRQMQMDVYVTPNRFFALPQGGRFRISGVPPGTHALRGWSANNRLKSARADAVVEAGKATRIDLVLESRSVR